MKIRSLTYQVLHARHLYAADVLVSPTEDTVDVAPEIAYQSRARPAISLLQTQRLEPSSGTRTAAPNNSAFRIEIVPGLALRNNATALAAVHRAAEQWEAILLDPINVTIHVDFVTDPTTGALATAAPIEVILPYSTVRAALQSDGLVEGDDSILASLPEEIVFAYPSGPRPIETISLTKANAKALGLSHLGLDDSLGVSDGAIRIFGGNETYDYSRADGIDVGEFDFESVIAHEIGHILGFVSAVDRLNSNNLTNEATVSPTVLDLFRFRSIAGVDNPRTPSAFGAIRRELRPSTPAVLDFVLQDGWNTLRNEYPLELGEDTSLLEPGVDFGYQASHWQSDDLAGEVIGIMGPVIAPQTIVPISNADLRAFDLIGYDILPPGIPANAPQLVDDTFASEGQTRVVLDVLANDRNNAEPLTLSSFRVIEPPSLGTVRFDVLTGLVVYEILSGASGIDIFTYTIADDRGIFAPPAVVTVTTTLANARPLAVDDFVLTRSSTPVTFNPLVNDFDADDTLSLAALTVVSQPARGSLTVVESGLRYEPQSGFVGEDSLVYEIRDSFGNTSQATVTIVVGAPLVPIVVPGIPMELLQRADTSGDNEVSTIDALEVLRYLKIQDSGEAELTADSNSRLDVSGDGHVTAQDALIVINILNLSQSPRLSLSMLPIDDVDEDEEFPSSFVE